MAESERERTDEEMRTKIAEERQELYERGHKKGIFIPRTAEDALSKMIDEAENPSPVIATGLRPLDNLLDGGIRPGEVFVLASRPRVGKTAFALQILLHAASDGHVTYVWTREMSEEAYMRRAIAARAFIDNRNIRTGKLSGEEWTRLYAEAGLLSRLPIFFAVGKPDIATVVDEMRAMCVYIEHAKMPLIVIDYLQLLEPPRGLGSREQEVAFMSRAIKGAAHDLGVGVVLVAQLNRRAEGTAPRIDDLRESGQIESDADIVSLLHRDKNEANNTLTPRGSITVVKNRDGQEGYVPLWFEGKHFKFTERLPDEG